MANHPRRWIHEAFGTVDSQRGGVSSLNGLISTCSGTQFVAVRFRGVLHTGKVFACVCVCVWLEKKSSDFLQNEFVSVRFQVAKACPC